MNFKVYLENKECDLLYYLKESYQKEADYYDKKIKRNFSKLSFIIR